MGKELQKLIRLAEALEVARVVVATVVPWECPDVTANCIKEDEEDELAANLAILRTMADFNI